MASQEPIVFDSNCGKLGGFEKLLSSKFRESAATDEVVLDLAGLTFLGAYATAMTFSWCMFLRSKGKRVIVKIPEQAEMSSQFHKMMVQLEVIAKLKENQVMSSSPVPMSYKPPSFPLKVISDEVTLKNLVLSYLKENEGSYQVYDVLNDVCNVFIHEIVENSLLHNPSFAYPYFFVNHSTPVNHAAPRKGVMAGFDEAYLEVCLGDIGTGINQTLDHSLPTEYECPFRISRTLRRSEKVLLYAFEFASTRDKAARRNRISTLMGSSETTLDPSQVASGLYAVLRTARHYQAQLLVRTTHEILSIDFTDNQDTPIVRGAPELKVSMKDIAPFPGTHYVIRFRPVIPQEKTTKPTRRDFRFDNTTVKRFFPTSRSQYIDEARILHEAIQQANDWLVGHRLDEGVLLIDSPATPLTSRAESIFLYSLMEMESGQRQILWNYSKTTSIPPSAASTSRSSKNEIFVGDLLANSFRRLATSESEGGVKYGPTGLVSLSAEAYKSLVEKVAAARAEDARVSISQPPIRDDKGPFLFQGKYYTNIFYGISEAFENEEYVQQFAAWASMVMPGEVEAIIAHSLTMQPAAVTLCALLSRAGARKIEFRVIQTPLSEPSLLQHNIALLNKKVAIITDVVCTGTELNTLLSLLASVKVSIILAVVDGRHPREISRPISWNTEGDAVSTSPLRALHSESIDPFKDLVGQTLGGEPLKVIDPTTKRPTLYVRPVAPQLNIDQVLERAATASSLFEGHLSHLDTHHTYFVYLPTLFLSVKGEIGTWIKNQISFLKTRGEYKSRVTILLYNADGSLSWLDQFFAESGLGSEVNLREVNQEMLLAPQPPSQPREELEATIIVMPAISSGQTAQMAIEYASRSNPKSIMVLPVLSRMEPRLLSFFSGISAYRSKPFRYATMMMMPIESYREGPSQCPVCSLRSRLVAVTNLQGMSSLQGIRTKWLNAWLHQTIDVSARPSGVEIATESKGYLKARIRALFALAEYDIDARRELNALLLQNETNVESFLEIVSWEFSAPQFSHITLKERLFKAYNIVINYAQKILETNTTSIGKHLFAIEHLTPGTLAARGHELIAKYGMQVEETEMLAIAIMTLRILPNSIEAWKKEVSQLTDGPSRRILDELVQFLAWQKEARHTNTPKALLAFEKLFGDLARSSPLDITLVDLDRKLQDVDQEVSADDKSGLFHLVDQISEYSNHPIVDRLEELKGSVLWEAVGNKLASKFDTFFRLVAQLSVYIRSEQTWPAISQFKTETTTIIREIRKTRDFMWKSMFGFVCSPAVLATNIIIGDSLRAQDGSLLQVKKTINYKTKLVLFDVDMFEYVCNQIVLNWKRHKAGKTGTFVSLTVRSDPPFVLLDFEDDIEGQFNENSVGGLMQVREISERFGAQFDTWSSTDGSNQKRLTLRFLSFTKELKPYSEALH